MKKINDKGYLIAYSILTSFMVLLEIAYFFLLYHVINNIMMMPSEVFDNKVLFVSIFETSLVILMTFIAIPWVIMTCLNNTINYYKKIK